MKILIESYNSSFQNPAGGISIRINNFIKHYKRLFPKDEIKLFNKWTDKIKDFDILHIFKVNIEDYQLMQIAESAKIPVIISSVIPNERGINIVLGRILGNIFHLHTGYWFLNKMLLGASKIICQTKSEMRFIRKYYRVAEQKIEIIPNGIGIEFKECYRDLIRKKIGIYGDYVLQVGRFDRNKNQLSVIKAMAKTNIPVLFIGGPDCYDIEYYEKCKREATTNMYFLGWIRYDDPLLASAYMNASVVILPSKKEIFGNALIEAAYAGAKIVVSNNVSVTDLKIADYCELINPYDINDIRKKIICALSKPKDLSIQNRIRNLYNWDNVIYKHNALYHIVAGEKKDKDIGNKHFISK